MAWTVIDCYERGKCRYLLWNGTYVPINYCLRAKVDFKGMIKKMNEMHVPIGYTHGIKEIYFTSIQDAAGDILDGKIRLSYGQDHWDQLPSALIHELGHHVDDREHLSSDPDIISEKGSKSKFMADQYAKKNVGEYVAVGFETYYFGTADAVAKMRRHNRVLFEKIQAIHERYSAS